MYTHSNHIPQPATLCWPRLQRYLSFYDVQQLSLNSLARSMQVYARSSTPVKSHLLSTPSSATGTHGRRTSMTLPGTHAPLCTSDLSLSTKVRAAARRDRRRVCSHSYRQLVRVSTWSMPNASRLASESHIPLSAACSNHSPTSTRAKSRCPSVDCGRAGPARCAKCRAYGQPVGAPARRAACGGGAISARTRPKVRGFT